jgi:diguanylate cyclase
LLNRRYFASVAKREIALAQRQQSVFALLMVDIDHFDRLRDALGLDGADVVLASVAEGLLDSVRAGDFVFRVGDARFALLLVETSADALPRLAEGLRQQVEVMRLRTASRAAVSLTASIGGALFDGHPDYQRLLDRADAALRAAQAAGFNRCVLDG